MAGRPLVASAKVHIGVNAARPVVQDLQRRSDRVAQSDSHIARDDVFAVGVGAHTERPRHESRAQQLDGLIDQREGLRHRGFVGLAANRDVD